MKKKAMLPILFAMILVLLTGCGKPETPEEIWKAYQEAAKDLQCTQLDMSMDLGLSMALPAMGSVYTVNLDMKVDAATVTTKDPFASQVDMTIDMHYYSPEIYMDQSTKLESQVYTVVEDSQLVSYAKTMGMWVRTETGMNPEALLKNADALVGASGIAFQKDESVTEWEGTPAVCLTATVTGDSVQSMMDTVMRGIGENLPGEAENLDYSALTCHTRIYFDTETWLPLAQETTVEGMEAMVDKALEEANLDMELTTCTSTIRYRSFAPQPPIQLPQEARDNAIDLE